MLGIPDARLGERVAAVVQRAAGSEIDAEALTGHLRSELARYKVPEHFRFVDELPRNAMNKIVKPKLLPLFEEMAARGA